MSPEQWEFLLRREDGEAVNVELRGEVHGTVREGDRVELLESREIRSQEVTVVSRLRNETLRSTVIATTPSWRHKAAAFLMPTSIWQPIGGIGATLLTLLVTTGGASDPPRPSIGPTATPTPGATSTPAPSPIPSDEVGDGGTGVLIAVIAVGVAALVVLWVLRARGSRTRVRQPSADAEVGPRRPHRGPRANVLRFGMFLVGGVLLGVGLRLIA